MTKSKQILSIEGSNELEKGNLNFNKKNFKDASKSYHKAIELFGLSLKKDGDVRDSKNLEEVTKKNLCTAIKNYGSSMIQAALELDLEDDFSAIIESLEAAIKEMSKADEDYKKDLEPNLVIAQQNLSTTYFLSKKYEEAIEGFLELAKYKSVDNKIINPMILNAYCLIEVNESDKEKMLEKAFAFIKASDEAILESDKDVNYVLEHLAKIYISKDKNMDSINELYLKVPLNDNISLVDKLYNDALSDLQIGVKDANKNLLKGAIKIISSVVKKENEYSLESNDILKSLIKEYGTDQAKDNYEKWVLGGHDYILEDFDL
jgi:tetratricopeptide (TPR) repeat protein